METQILNLKEPYEYICCNGSIGLHIATMIVYEAKTYEDGEYELETHSHPVVKYYNRPGGTVWNRAELTDCSVLCREDSKRITMEQFYNFVSDAPQLADSSSEGPTPPTVDIVVSKEKLRRNGIEIEWPMVRSERGKMVPQKEFDISLGFRQNDEDGYDYSCYDMGLSDEDIHTGAAPLSVFFNFKTKKELKAQLIYVMGAYYAMFKGHDFHIQFYWPEGSEFADVVNEVNQKEPEIRKRSNDINV